MHYLLWLWPLLMAPVWAYHQVEAALDEHTLLVALDPEHELKVEDRVVILSQRTRALLAMGSVKRLHRDQFPETASVTVKEVIGSQLILPGDGVEELSVETLNRYQVPGHISLLLAQEEKIPAKYKELAYLGVFNSDGHTLAAKEWLISLPQVQYGLNDQWTMKILNGLYLDGFANVGAKLRVMRNQWGHLTMNGLVSRQIDREDWVFLGGLVLTLPTNEKFQSHLVINARLEGIEEENPEVEKLNLFPPSDIRTIYEYLTDDWNRVLFGPLFNFDTQTVGGTMSYMWIWDEFHVNLGLATKDVSRAKFDSQGYYLLFDFFWRF